MRGFSVLSHKPTTVAVYMTCLVVLHVLWHSTKFLNFTHEYLRVITRGLSHMCEVIVELYRNYLLQWLFHK